MRIQKGILILLLALALGLLVAVGALAQEPLRMTVYYSPTCDHCEYVDEQVLPPIAAAYGDRLEIVHVDVTTSEGLAELEDVEARLGQPNNPLPVIVIDDQIYADEDFFALEDKLWEALEAQLGEAATPAPTSTAQAAPTDEPARGNVATPNVLGDARRAQINVAYIERDGCSVCERASVMLQAVAADYPNMVVTVFNNSRDAELIEAMGAYLGLPEERRLIAPSIYVGSDALVDEEVTSTRLKALLDKYNAEGAEPFWENLEATTGKNSLISRFRAMGPVAVVAAALIDGINPCAFATILFFVSYLAISRRQRRELLFIGLAFTLGVFVAYSLVGFGALSLLRWLTAFRVVGAVLYTLLAATCLLLAGVSIYDFGLARQGRLKEMRLNLSDNLRERIKNRIRHASGAFVWAAFVSGLLVSLMELACTGQMYLPTISFVLGVPELRSWAVGYLLLYNVFFVVPLLVVLLLAVYGVSATRFQDWFVKNAAGTKLVMAIVFLLLSGLLFAQALSA